MNVVEAGRYACDSIANGVSWARLVAVVRARCCSMSKGSAGTSWICHMCWIPHSEQSPAIEKRAVLVSSQGELELELEMPKVEVYPRLISQSYGT